MIIGLPKELKDNEYRVGMVPSGVHALVADGHSVFVEEEAGQGSGFTDQEYVEAGGTVLKSADEVYGRSDMVVKVKEPIEPEYPRLREGLIVFSYLHLAPLPVLTKALADSKVTGVAYETISDRHGNLPLLTPMSEVAGRMSIQVGSYYLSKPRGGRGVLVGGVPGVWPARVAVIGGGTVGVNAAKMAMGLNADVTVLDVDMEKLRYLDDVFLGRIKTVYSNHYNIAQLLASADLVIGAVLIVGANAPKLVTRGMLVDMNPGAVVVDVAVDQGGCFETTRPTTHSDPVYKVEEVVHYCVTNMPGAMPRTSTFALTNATQPYINRIAAMGLEGAIENDPLLEGGVNTYKGHITCRPVADAQNRPYQSYSSLK